MLHKYLSVHFSNTWKGFTEKREKRFKKTNSFQKKEKKTLNF